MVTEAVSTRALDDKYPVTKDLGKVEIIYWNSISSWMILLNDETSVIIHAVYMASEVGQICDPDSLFLNSEFIWIKNRTDKANLN